MLFRYIIEFYTEDLDLYPNASEIGFVVDKGIITESSWGEAVDAIVHYFGDDNILSVKIWEIENPLCDEEIKDMMEE
jgi:hypothetical protein